MKIDATLFWKISTANNITVEVRWRHSTAFTFIFLKIHRVYIKERNFKHREFYSSEIELLNNYLQTKNQNFESWVKSPIARYWFTVFANKLLCGSDANSDILKTIDALGREATKYPFLFCKAVWWKYDEIDGEPKFHNGTMTFISLEERNVGITCHHVLEEYRENKKLNPNLKCSVGNVRLDMVERLIDESKELDIVVIDLNDIDVSEDIGLGSCQFLAPAKWPPNPVKLGDSVIFGGYPGQWRVVNEDKVAFDTFSCSGAFVIYQSKTKIRVEYTKEFFDTADFGAKKELDLDHFGGISGCPVFVDRQLYKEFVGIVSAGGDMFFEIVPAGIIQVDGALNKEDSL